MEERKRKIDKPDDNNKNAKKVKESQGNTVNHYSHLYTTLCY